MFVFTLFHYIFDRLSGLFERGKTRKDKGILTALGSPSWTLLNFQYTIPHRSDNTINYLVNSMGREEEEVDFIGLISYVVYVTM